MMFSRPLHPTLPLGLWGALHAPADAFLDPGGPMAYLVAVISVWSWMTSLSWWGGSPRLLLGEEVPASVFIAVACAVLLGVVSGQYRWRSGVAVWQQLSRRPAWTLLAGAAGRVAVAAVTAVGVPALVMGLVTTWDPARHGVGAGIVVTEFLAGWPPTLLVLAEVAVGAALGVCAGWWSGRIWMAPACLILGLAVMIAVPRPPGQDVDRLWAERYGFTACQTVPGHDVRICAPAPDKGYLPAAAASLSQIYGQSPHPEALPRLVLLTTTGTMGENAHPKGLENPPDIGAAPGRGITPPTALGSPAGDSLTYSTHAWCAGTELTDLQNLFGVDEYAQTPIMNRTLAALKTCQV